MPEAAAVGGPCGGCKGDSVFLDLGDAQKMKPLVTFSVHAVSPDGSLVPTSKGSLEVLNVFESGSQAHIQQEKNKNDPIKQGDVLVNPNWNPDRKKAAWSWPASWT